MSIWHVTGKELVFRSFLFRIFKVGYRSEKSGKEGQFDVLETVDWVNVVPVTEDGQVIMVQQFRYGVGELTLEFPAGAIEPGQTHESAARRELSEETGGDSEALVLTGHSRPNPAFLNNTCYHYMATGVRLGKEQNLDELEEIEVKLVPLEQIESMISAGKISHSLSISAWHFFKSHSGRS